LVARPTDGELRFCHHHRSVSPDLPASENQPPADGNSQMVPTENSHASLEPEATSADSPPTENAHAGGLEPSAISADSPPAENAHASGAGDSLVRPWRARGLHQQIRDPAQFPRGVPIRRSFSEPAATSKVPDLSHYRDISPRSRSDLETRSPRLADQTFSPAKTVFAAPNPGPLLLSTEQVFDNIAGPVRADDLPSPDRITLQEIGEARMIGYNSIFCSGSRNRVKCIRFRDLALPRSGLNQQLSRILGFPPSFSRLFPGLLQQL